MDKSFEIGSIVLLMDDNSNIYKAMIVQKYVIENGKKYEYRGVTYPYGFVGVDNFTAFNEENIFGKVYDSSNPKEQNSKELVPSSIIMHNENKYIIIGKNVKHLGQEKDDEYAIMKYNTQDDFVIEYILGKNIESVVTYGFINYEYEELEVDRYSQLNLALRRYMPFLPIGSVVELNTNDKEKVEMMILGRNVEQDGEISDYIGIVHENTYLGNEYVFPFNKNQIVRIIYIGYFNEKEVEYNTEMLISRGFLDRR